MGFLDELKKLAENRSGNSDGLLIDTLKKTNATSASKSSPGMKVVKQLHPDDHKRKQHGKRQYHWLLGLLFSLSLDK